MKFHHNPFTTPEKDDIIGRPPKHTSQYYCGEDTVMVDDVPKVVERFLSEGSYTVTIGEDTFDQILKVLPEIPFPELPPMHPVQALEWVSGEKKSHTADLIIEVLSDHVMFKDHYVPRFPYGKEIPSGFRVSNINKPRGSARSSHGFAAYLTGMCSHNVSIRGAAAKQFNMCSSRCVVGFKPEDIALLKGNTPKKTIDLCIEVEKHCTHLKHYNNTRLAGVARQRVIKREGFREDATFHNPLSRELYKKYKKPAEKGLSTEKVKNRDVIYKVKGEMLHLLHGHYGFKVGMDRDLMWCMAVHTIALKDKGDRVE
jgi:hypothetical protein